MTRQRLTTLLAAIGASLLLARVGPGAVAASRAAEGTARQHFLRGEMLYAEAQFPEALVEFQAGYGALPLPGFLVNIGQCHRQLGDMTAARASYENFLTRAPDSPLAPEVRRLIQEVTLTPGRLVVAPTQPASSNSNGRAASATATSRASKLKPTLAVILRAKPQPEVASAAGAELGRETTTEATDDVPEVGRRRWWWIWSAVAVATATAVVSAVVIGGGGTTTTLHDGTLGTLRR